MRLRAHGAIYVWSRLQASVLFCTICVVAKQRSVWRQTMDVLRDRVHGVQMRWQRKFVGKEGADN
jgi:hypothetical protein